jgi:hypothetical protein
MSSPSPEALASAYLGLPPAEQRHFRRLAHLAMHPGVSRHERVQNRNWLVDQLLLSDIDGRLRDRRGRPDWSRVKDALLGAPGLAAVVGLSAAQLLSARDGLARVTARTLGRSYRAWLRGVLRCHQAK